MQNSNNIPDIQRVSGIFAHVTTHFFLLQDKLSSPAAQTNSESNSSDENGYKGIQVSQTAKGERIKELKEQVDSLQNVILQVSITRTINRRSLPKCNSPNGGSRCLFFIQKRSRSSTTTWWHFAPS